MTNKKFSNGLKKAAAAALCAVVCVTASSCAALLLGAGAAGAGAGTYYYSKNHKQCPFCKRYIHVEASKCRYCRADYPKNSK